MISLTFCKILIYSVDSLLYASHFLVLRERREQATSQEHTSSGVERWNRVIGALSRGRVL